MHLRIAGVVHFDVRGKARLSDWLQRTRRVENGDPEFVAVEYEQDIFERIRARRQVIRGMAAELWPSAPGTSLDVIEESLGYEGDLHDKVFPRVKTIWLDEGRKIKDPTVIERYACDRFNLYRGYAVEQGQSLSASTLNHMSTQAWAAGPPPIRGGDARDEIFASRLLEWCVRGQNCWGICIVGANHATDVEGSMVSRLQCAGVECDVSFLRPEE